MTELRQHAATDSPAGAELFDLVCPLTRLPLVISSLADARDRIADGRALARRESNAGVAAAVGESDPVLLRADNRAAYPIIDGIPILLGPERLSAPGEAVQFDLTTGHYAEAYNETPFYDAEAIAKTTQIENNSLVGLPFDGLNRLGLLHQMSLRHRSDFPNPPLRWLAASVDSPCEWDCFAHLAPVQERRMAQIGGTGEVAMTLLLAGTRAAILITPMLGEARLARALARKLGVAERFRCAVGIAEELPLPDTSLEIVYSGGSVHHMTTELAFPEVARVLRSGGRFAAMEPWRAPLYALGTRVFGKREANPFCRPLTRARVAPLFQAFSQARCIQHGALTRYPMLAMQKLGARISQATAWRVGRTDDRICAAIPGLRRLGSGVALLATK
ncbi:MAG TPA: methyltransferase domain-containing protein [Steroidobacteraceae bacterium]|jgi:uncharacterized protein YbaR (Trm112 family)